MSLPIQHLRLTGEPDSPTACGAEWPPATLDDSSQIQFCDDCMTVAKKISIGVVMDAVFSGGDVRAKLQEAVGHMGVEVKVDA